MAGDRQASPRYSKVAHTKQSSTYSEKPGPRRWSLAGGRSFLWMVLSLLSGVALSVGHHFFYARFDGQRVDEVSISQTWIIRFGTVFAFVAKTLLVVAASIAFVQQQWSALSRHPFKVRQIDTMTGVLGNALCFLESRLWLRFPILTILAVVAWLLPLAAVITPATINVVTRDNIASVDSTPPQLYLDPNQYANLQTNVPSVYVSPSPEALGSAFGSAMTKQLIGISQASPNMTYDLQFYGPALRCDYADPTFISGVYDTYLRNFRSPENSYRYFAWVPVDGKNRTDLSVATSESNYTAECTLDVVSTDAAHLYIVPNTSIAAGPVFAGGIQLTPEDAHYGIQDLLDCKLYNASYQTHFNLTFPTQAIEVRSRELLNPVNVSLDIRDWQSSSSTSELRAREAQRISYQSIMDAFGRLLVGTEWRRDGWVTTLKTSWNMVAIDWTKRDEAMKGLEQLFQNITLSMLSVPSLTMNETIAAQNRVPVSVLTSVNVYTYNARDLWLAYGIACGAALLSTLLGAYGIWRNGGVGYQSIFSTFVRTTRDQVLKEMVEPEDRGTEPLPKRIAEASIMLDT